MSERRGKVLVKETYLSDLGIGRLELLPDGAHGAKLGRVSEVMGQEELGCWTMQRKDQM